MKIAFFGDSLTEGFPGVSSYGILKKELPGHKLYNYGKGGDTVFSLLKRLRQTRLKAIYDLSFVWIGVNDVLAEVSWTFKIIKKLRRQPWTSDTDLFEARYLQLLKIVKKRSQRTVTVSPLFIGEDLTSGWNLLLKKRANIIKGLSDSMPNVHFIDLQDVFRERLEGIKVRPYVPRSVLSIFRDLVRSIRGNKKD
ncbi:MAG: SGNH/GDSL hydrolase family protein, partial [Candidatus Aminicenantes bacterium]|nr:SGNH/GDSL hydrolase family protein [Candidatus Aminicenantes bacterium]